MTEAKTKSDQTSLSLDLQINNSDLSSLVGPLDSNLAQLENFLNVEISRRGASSELREHRQIAAKPFSFDGLGCHR